MKKILIPLLLVIMFLIPIEEKNIRIRVLANSNDEYDQEIKKEVVEIVKDEFKSKMQNIENIDKARVKIENSLPELSSKIDKFLQEKNINYGFKINFGLNYFPPKELNGKKYDEGYYESVLITLGKGSGDNWWCILFPSICLTEENANYESLIKNIFEKIFY